MADFSTGTRPIRSETRPPTMPPTAEATAKTASVSATSRTP